MPLMFFRACLGYPRRSGLSFIHLLIALTRSVQDTLLAPERYLGLYIGMMTVCVLFWLCSLRVGMIGNYEPFGPPQGMESSYSRSLKPESVLALSRSAEFLTVGALSMATDDFNLFVAAIVLLACSSLIWTYLVWIGTDPGAVHSRTEDFDMVSNSYICCQEIESHGIRNLSVLFFILS